MSLLAFNFQDREKLLSLIENAMAHALQFFVVFLAEADFDFACSLCGQHFEERFNLPI